MKNPIRMINKTTMKTKINTSLRSSETRLTNISELKGNVLVNIFIGDDDDVIIFSCDNGKDYQMYHEQDCCESVIIEDVNGDWEDLIDSPILLAEERMSDTENDEDEYESKTWTFYTIRTRKGTVVIRWLGTSNGYYSETVDFVQRPTTIPRHTPPNPPHKKYINNYLMKKIL